MSAASQRCPMSAALDQGHVSLPDWAHRKRTSECSRRVHGLLRLRFDSREHALSLLRDKRLPKWSFMCRHPTAAQLRLVRVLVVGVGPMAIGAAHERHIPHKLALAQTHTHRCPCPCTDARTRAQTHTNRRTRTRAATHVHAQMHMRTHRCP